jgi:riboflavin synthase
VNLERSLKAGGRLSGHFVTGHIDGMGKIIAWEQVGDDRQLQITAPENVMRYVIHKGSIALDGISLTVAKVEKVSFTIWIIPHTFDVTALKERALGAAVNLEADMIGKYVERFTAN